MSLEHNDAPSPRQNSDMTPEHPWPNIHGRGDKKLLPILTGLIAGGCVARLGLELSDRPWPWPMILALGALSAGIGAFAFARSATFIHDGDVTRWKWWPVLLCSIYLVWPQRQPLLGLQLLAVILLALILGQGRRISSANLPLHRVADLVTFALSFTCYLLTTASDVLPADSGEFQIVAPLLGVAHPPGYPLYTMLGWLFTRLLPFGNQAYRLNLMSALFAAGTLTLVGAATRHWVHHVTSPRTSPSASSRQDQRPRAKASHWSALVGGIVAALTLGTATTFWAQAVVANIRMPTVFAAAVGLFALAHYTSAKDRQQADRDLVLLAAALSLGIGHHPSLAFIGVFFILYLIWVDPRLLVQPRRWLKPLLAVVVGLFPLLYLPLRGAADPPLAPPELNTWDGFVHHVTAQGFEGDMFAFANAQDLPQRLTLLPGLFRFQFNPLLLAAAVLGLLVLARRHRQLLLLLLGGLVLHTFVTITYRAPQTVEYMMPAYLPIAILVGIAAAWPLADICRRAPDSLRIKVANWTTLQRLGRQFERLLPSDSRDFQSVDQPFVSLWAALILMAGVVNGLEHGPSYFTLARDRSTRTAMESILDDAPAGARVLADWHWSTALWYLQRIEGQRPDIQVRYVYPIPGQEYPVTWRDNIQQVPTDQPLILTHYYDLPGYSLQPLGQGFAVHQRPYTTPPRPTYTDWVPVPEDTIFGSAVSGVRILGFQLSDAHPTPGQAIELTLAWQSVGQLTVPPSFSAKLSDQDGRQLAQSDRFLGTDFAPGEVRFERLALPLYPGLPPGDYLILLQVYSVGEVGFENWPLQTGATELPLTMLPVRADRTPPLSLHPLDVPFLGGPSLIGVDYDRTVPNTLRVYLHWQGPAQDGERIVVEGVQTQLPTLAKDGYQTLALDLPAEIHHNPQLTLMGVDGQEKTAAGPWGRPITTVQLPAPARDARFVMLTDEIALIGVAPTNQKSFAPGEEFLMRPTFLALRPLVNDYAVSIRLLDETGQWIDKHDLQPGLGALPTLKWIRGARISDPHPLSVPPDITGSVMRANLVVYENFRGITSIPLDGRMEQVPLGEWQIRRP